MKRRSKFFLVLFFVVMTAPFMHLVLASSGSLTPETAGNGTRISILWFNVSNNSTTGNTLTNILINITGSASVGNITNISVYSGPNVYSNSTFTSYPVLINMGATITSNTNYTINFTISPSASNNSTIGANVTSITSGGNVTYSALPYSSSLVTIDSQLPVISFVNSPLNDSWGRGNLTVNVSAFDSLSNISSILIYVNGTKVEGCSSSPCYYTNNSADGMYAVSATANDTYNHTATASLLLGTDNTPPTASFNCNPTSQLRGDLVSCSCSPSDAMSGINSSATSYSEYPSTDYTGEFSTTCTFKDNAGNIGSAEAVYYVYSVSSYVPPEKNSVPANSSQNNSRPSGNFSENTTSYNSRSNSLPGSSPFAKLVWLWIGLGIIILAVIAAMFYRIKNQRTRRR